MAAGPLVGPAGVYVDFFGTFRIGFFTAIFAARHPGAADVFVIATIGILRLVCGSVRTFAASVYPEEAKLLSRDRRTGRWVPGLADV
jgi:fluoride ion exporter CrcB/FEX